jgi:hypothetical protein
MRRKRGGRLFFAAFVEHHLFELNAVAVFFSPTAQGDEELVLHARAFVELFATVANARANNGS